MQAPLVESATEPFPLIADPANYRAHTVDLLAEPEALVAWLAIFRNHVPTLVRSAIESEGGGTDATRRAQRMAEDFTAKLDRIASEPTAFGHPCVPLLCTLRERLLRRHGFADPYRHVKIAENAAALRALPPLLQELDAIDDPTAKLHAVIEGAFAGNIFDMGSVHTIALFEKGGIDFHATRKGLPRRPWLVDDLEALTARFADVEHRRAVVFVDNSGADVTLGMVPLIRLLLSRGTDVVVTANTAPALNDITHEELIEHLGAVAGLDATIADALADGRLTTVASGNGIPLIDLSRVSAELAAACDGADLLVLQGMGRALESNFYTRFRVDTLKLAMVKEEDVALRLGGKLYDVICRFEPTPRLGL